ncbi:MAG: CDP-alcohol phosphatidyltransferase family protein [Promethearchaeota archaeon]
MPSLFRIRYVFKPLIRLIAKGLARLGLTPNIATIIMLCFSFFCLISIALFRNLLCFAILVFVTGIWDGLDGQIARLTNKATKLGGFFDSFMDRISEFFIYLGLLIFFQNNILWHLIDVKLVILVSFISSIMISYCRARAEPFFKGDFDIGLMARSERFFYIFITMILAHFIGFASEFLFVFMWLVLGTFIFRLFKIYYLIKNKEKEVNE